MGAGVAEEVRVPSWVRLDEKEEIVCSGVGAIVEGVVKWTLRLMGLSFVVVAEYAQREVWWEVGRRLLLEGRKVKDVLKARPCCK